MNIENYQSVLAEIEAHPERWDQKHWCGTACCFAGHAQLMAGKGPRILTVREDAIEYLGIDELYAAYLFSDARTLEDFRSFGAMTETERLEVIVETDPCGVLQCVADRLTDEQFDRAVKAAPWYALKYAAHRMTPEQIDWAVKAEPAVALQYANHRLTDEQFDRAAKAEPWAALKYALNRLTPEQLDWAAKAAPWYALEYAAHRMTPEQTARAEAALREKESQ